MNIWHRSAFYRVYVVGGLVAVVALTVTLAPSFTNPALAGLPVAAWVVGLIAQQGRMVLRDGQGGGARGPRVPAASPHDPPADPFAALSLTGASGDGERELHRFARWHFVGLAGGSLLCMAAGMLSVSGLVDPSLVLAPPVLLTLGAALLVPRNVRHATELSDAYLEPLGLRITGMPGLGTWIDATGDVRPALRGATVLSGRRHGRHVRAGFGLGETVVELECAGPAFRAVTDAGRFVPADGTPAAVGEALALTGAPARWRSAEVIADGATLTVRRRRRASAMPEWWLDDLWLAERLADVATRVLDRRLAAAPAAPAGR